MAALTQSQALSPWLSLYREVWRIGLDLPIEAEWAKRPGRLPHNWYLDNDEFAIARQGVYNCASYRASLVAILTLLG